MLTRPYQTLCSLSRHLATIVLQQEKKENEKQKIESKSKHHDKEEHCSSLNTHSAGHLPRREWRLVWSYKAWALLEQTASVECEEISQDDEEMKAEERVSLRKKDRAS